MCDVGPEGGHPGTGPESRARQAHGLSFSVQRPVPPPPGLENLYKEPLQASLVVLVLVTETSLRGPSEPRPPAPTVRAHRASSRKAQAWEPLAQAAAGGPSALQGPCGLALRFLRWEGQGRGQEAPPRVQTPAGVRRALWMRALLQTRQLLRKPGEEPISRRAGR